MLLDKRLSYKPFEYQWAYDYWYKQNAAHWMRTEVDMSKDLKDWKEKLTIEEKEVVGGILKSFAQTETFVEDYWSSKVGKWFPKSEIKNMAHCFANMESIHADSYIFLNETLGLTDFDSFLNDESVMAKLDEIIEILDSNKQDIKSIAKSLVVFSVCTEGINLFSSFMILLSFKRKNKLQGVGQIVEFSCKDEDLHSEAGCRLFNELIKEYPHIWTDELKGEIYTAVELAIKNEFHYINQIFGNRQLETISKDEVKNYMFYRANKKLKEIGLKEKYLVDNQLLEQTSWFEAFTKGSQRTDFFAQQETNYSKPKDDWSLLL
jgi:ribonucleoside-diphosphate reductase beta chain